MAFWKLALFSVSLAVAAAGYFGYHQMFGCACGASCPCGDDCPCDH